MATSNKAAWQARNEAIKRGFDTDDPQMVREWLGRFAYFFRRKWSLVAHEAEDLAQKALLTAYERLEEFSGEGPIDAWLYGIANNIGRHAVRSFHRRRGEETEPLEDVEEWDQLSSEEDFSDRKVATMYMDEFLARLEPEQQLLVRRRIYDSAPWATVAEELGITETAAHQRLPRILRKLGEWIEAEEPWLKKGRSQ